MHLHRVTLSGSHVSFVTWRVDPLVHSLGGTSQRSSSIAPVLGNVLIAAFDVVTKAMHETNSVTEIVMRDCIFVSHINRVAITFIMQIFVPNLHGFHTFFLSVFVSQSNDFEANLDREGIRFVVSSRNNLKVRVVLDLGYFRFNDGGSFGICFDGGSRFDKI